MFVNPTGTISITCPVPRETFDRVAIPSIVGKVELVLYDRPFIDLKVIGAMSSQTSSTGGNVGARLGAEGDTSARLGATKTDTPGPSIKCTNPGERRLC